MFVKACRLALPSVASICVCSTAGWCRGSAQCSGPVLSPINVVYCCAAGMMPQQGYPGGMPPQQAHMGAYGQPPMGYGGQQPRPQVGGKGVSPACHVNTQPLMPECTSTLPPLACAGIWTSMRGSFACCISLLTRACCMRHVGILLQGFPPGPGMGVQGPPGAVRPPMQPPTQQTAQPAPQQSAPLAASTAPITPGAGAAGASASVWTEHTAPDGRKYYHNKATKQSSWTKLDAMKSPGPVSSMLSWAESFCQTEPGIVADAGRQCVLLCSLLYMSASWLPSPQDHAGFRQPRARWPSPQHRSHCWACFSCLNLLC